MNPLVYLLLALIFIFVSFIYLASLYAIYEPDHELYEHPHICEGSFPYCFETKNFYFKRLHAELDMKNVERDVNRWFEDINQSKKFEIKYDPEKKKFHAIAKEDINKSDIIFVHSQQTIFSKMSFYESSFNQHMNQTKLTNDRYAFTKLNLTSVPNILILLMSYHIFHLEFSIYRPWIETFDPSIETFFSKMTQYEYNNFIKNNKEIQNFAKDYFETLDKDWKNLDYLLKKRLTTEERLSVFNGHKFTKSDYIFAKIVTERHGWAVGNQQEIIMYPGNEFFERKNIESNSSYTDYFRQQSIEAIDNETVHLKLLADRPILKGEQIYQNFFEPRSFLSAFIFGKAPKFSYFDCIVSEIFYYEDIFDVSEVQKQFLRWASESGTLCLNLNPVTLTRMRLVGSILNMKKNELDDCLNVIKDAKTLEEQYGIFVNKCANPEWKVFDPRKLALKSLNSALEFYTEYYKNVVSYLEMRKKYGKDAGNAQILADYTKEKLNLNHLLLDKIKKISNNRFEDLVDHESAEKVSSEENAKGSGKNEL